MKKQIRCYFTDFWPGFDFNIHIYIRSAERKGLPAYNAREYPNICRRKGLGEEKEHEAQYYRIKQSCDPFGFEKVYKIRVF